MEVLRPESLELGLRQEGSSVGQRIVSARLGLEALKDRPVFGLGWQGSRYLLEEDPAFLLRTSATIPWQRFYGPSANTSPYSPANTYTQLMVETGLVGFGVVTGFLLTLAVSFIRLARRTKQYLPVLGALWTVGMGFWFNGTGLFGGGAEQVLFWSAAGLYFACAGASSAPLPIAKRRSVFQRQLHAQANL